MKKMHTREGRRPSLGVHKYGNSNSQIWKNNKKYGKIHVRMRVKIQRIEHLKGIYETYREYLVYG